MTSLNKLAVSPQEQVSSDTLVTPRCLEDGDFGIQSFYSVRLVTSSAKEMAAYLQTILGLEKIAYQGLENGNSCLASHVLRKNDVVLEISGTLETRTDFRYDSKKKCALEVEKTEMENKTMHTLEYLECQRSVVRESLRYNAVQKYFGKPGATKQNGHKIVLEAATASAVEDFISIHGMGVFDVVFLVKDVRRVFSKAVAAGALVIRQPEITSDKNGSVFIATVGTPVSDLRHTLVQLVDYKGPYLPGYASVEPKQGNVAQSTAGVLCDIDHCVQNFSWNELNVSTQFYISAFGLHKFWSVDDKDVSTENAGLRSIVLTNTNQRVKMPINEPAMAKMRGQIEEFYDYYGGPGVQHIAIRTDDIIETVITMKKRGIEFNSVSSTYYKKLGEHLDIYNIELHEDLKILKEHHILLDFDPSTRFKQKNGKFLCHYILQIFTNPIHDRPTLFFEIIQRYNHNGFGKGTFRGLFESIEEQQKLRGTLVSTEHKYGGNCQ